MGELGHQSAGSLARWLGRLCPPAGSLVLTSWIACAHWLGRLCPPAASLVPTSWVACAHQLDCLCPPAGSLVPISWVACAHPLGRSCPSPESLVPISWVACAHQLGPLWPSAGRLCPSAWPRVPISWAACAHQLGHLCLSAGPLVAISLGRRKIKIQVASSVRRLLRIKILTNCNLIFGRPKNATHDLYLDGRPRARTDGRTDKADHICTSTKPLKKVISRLVNEIWGSPLGCRGWPVTPWRRRPGGTPNLIISCSGGQRVEQMWRRGERSGGEEEVGQD